jgi:hypothetical protein
LYSEIREKLYRVIIDFYYGKGDVCRAVQVSPNTLCLTEAIEWLEYIREQYPGTTCYIALVELGRRPSERFRDRLGAIRGTEI